MSDDISLSPNKLVQYLNKNSHDFTKADIIKYIKDHEIRMLNFRYVAGDGRLKTLNFAINSMDHLNTILTQGERVDGSSLFGGISPTSSDLYVIPQYKTAFLNPFTEVPAVDIICSFYNSKGQPFVGSPGYIVEHAHKIFKQETGYTFEALGELEYYLFSDEDTIYPVDEQRGYHESYPFSKWGVVRRETMRVLNEIGCKIKYGHAEVGNIINKDIQMVQHEIEFLPCPVEDAANQLVIAKWAVRVIAYLHGLEVSFAPKIIVGHAGSGLHIHSRILKDGVSQMTTEDGELSDTAKKMIAGYLTLAPSLSAFGNTVPTSYLRLVPHQEAPTSICWGDKNRSVLVRVPLGWRGTTEMIFHANPNEPREEMDSVDNQTVEIRSADGSAKIHLLLAGLTVAALKGLQMKDAIKIADKYYVDVNLNEEDRSEYPSLPTSCGESADLLQIGRKFYEENDVFHPDMLDRIITELKSYGDEDLSEKLFGDRDKLEDLVYRYIHCG